MRAVIAAPAQSGGAGVDVAHGQPLGTNAQRRRVTLDDVAALALFLCSPAARNLTGQAVSIHSNAGDA